VRGAEREYETTLGDYKEVAGWYLPYSFETNVKGSQDKSKIVYEKIDANVPIDDQRFEMPVTSVTPEKPADMDASKKLPKKPGQEPPSEKKPPVKPKSN